MKTVPFLTHQGFCSWLYFSHWLRRTYSILPGHWHFQAVTNNAPSCHFFLEHIISFLSPGQRKAGPATPAPHSSQGSHRCAGNRPGDLSPGRTTFNTKSTNGESFKALYVVWVSGSPLVKTDNNTPAETAVRTNKPWKGPAPRLVAPFHSLPSICC